MRDIEITTECLDFVEKQDEKNAEEYQDMLSNGGNISAGRFLLNVAGNGWNGLSEAINQLFCSSLEVNLRKTGIL